MKFDEDKKFFDLFFLDYYMKRLTGLETALHIRSFSKACPIAFVTAAEKCDFMEAIPFEVLFKPAHVSKKSIANIRSPLDSLEIN